MNSHLILIFMFLTFSYLITDTLTTDLASRYDDGYEDSMRRLNFGRNYTKRVTGGKIKFEYSDSKGVYCKANDHLYPKQFAFDIPKEFIICSFDIFPYKFELKEPIFNFLKKRIQVGGVQSTNTLKYLFAFALMYANYENKSPIEEHLKLIQKEYYITKTTRELKDYLDSLPTATYDSSVYGTEEKILLDLTGFIKFEIEDETTLVHQEVIKYVTTKFKKDAEFILPWISDLFLFKYYNSIIASRAYKTFLSEYEKIINKSILETPMGKQHKDLLKEIIPTDMGACLIPFVDLCNHENALDSKGKNKIDFLMIYKKNKIGFAFSKEFEQGEDYEYSYVPFSPNSKLLTSYGFYVDENPQSVTEVNFPMQKAFFPKFKHDLCLKLKCFDNAFNHFYMDQKLQSVNVQIFVDKHEINQKIINAIRLYAWPVQKYDQEFISKRFLKNRWLSYENEMMSLAFYRESLKLQMGLSKLNLVDILYSLNETRNYYKMNKPEILKDSKKRYLYRLRRRIMQVAKESKKILVTQVYLAQHGLKKVLSDQFRKIRNYYEADTTILGQA